MRVSPEKNIYKLKHFYQESFPSANICPNLVNNELFSNFYIICLRSGYNVNRFFDSLQVRRIRVMSYVQLAISIRLISCFDLVSCFEVVTTPCKLLLPLCRPRSFNEVMERQHRDYISEANHPIQDPILQWKSLLTG